jgi:predicted nucleic acid-binding Zn ribbon protein
MDQPRQPRRSRVQNAERGPELLGEVLSRIFAARGWGRRQERTRLEVAWREALGPAFADHTRLGILRRGTLEVLVDNAVVMQELAHFHKRRLLDHLRRQLPDMLITALRFRAGG